MDNLVKFVLPFLNDENEKESREVSAAEAEDCQDQNPSSQSPFKTETATNTARSDDVADFLDGPALDDENRMTSLSNNRICGGRDTLSLKFLASFSRGCCPCEEPHHSHPPDEDYPSIEYDFKALKRSTSVVSPLVLAPMQQQQQQQQQSSLGSVNSTSIVQDLLGEYVAACHLYGCADRINAGVLTTLRYQLPALRVTGDFHDTDMLALCELLLRHCNQALKYVRRLDFSRAAREGQKQQRGRGFGSHGAYALAQVLAKARYIQQVDVQRHRIGAFGATAIFLAVSQSESLQTVWMRKCRIGERGGLAFWELIAKDFHKRQCALREIDLSANRIGFKASHRIEKALADNHTQLDAPYLIVNMEGNLPLQEVMNGSTHGFGVLLGLLGAYFLMKKVEGSPHDHVVSCMLYSTSLLVLYISSTLYHSFFALQSTRYIFEVFDKCAIYILIAGSYTPFLTILMGHSNSSIKLMVFIWFDCVMGILVEAFYPTWVHKPWFSLAMYLGMGWSVLFFLPEVINVLEAGCVNLLFLGGVAYTAGVPFFLRNNNLDHSIWHLFVLAGSIFHWCSVYFYVVGFQRHDMQEIGGTEAATNVLSASSVVDSIASDVLSSLEL